MFPLCCNRVPNQARTSGLRLRAWLTNSQIPDWMRIACSAIIDSMQLTMGPMNTAWEIGWA